MKAPTPDDFLDDWKKKPLTQLLDGVRSGDPAEILEVFNEKMAFLKYVKMAHVIRINAARETDRETHQQAVDEMLEVFPGEPAAFLAAISGYIHFKQLGSALDAIDRLLHEGKLRSPL